MVGFLQRTNAVQNAIEVDIDDFEFVHAEDLIDAQDIPLLDGANSNFPSGLKRLITCRSRSASAEAAISRCSLDSPPAKRMNGDGTATDSDDEWPSPDDRWQPMSDAAIDGLSNQSSPCSDRPNNPAVIYSNSDDMCRFALDSSSSTDDDGSSSFGSRGQNAIVLDMSDPEDEFLDAEDGLGLVRRGTPTCTDWSDLSAKILGGVFDYLNYCDLYFCGLVNPHWQLAVCEYWEGQDEIRLSRTIHPVVDKPPSVGLLHPFCFNVRPVKNNVH